MNLEAGNEEERLRSRGSCTFQTSFLIKKRKRFDPKKGERKKLKVDKDEYAKIHEILKNNFGKYRKHSKVTVQFHDSKGRLNYYSVEIKGFDDYNIFDKKGAK